MSETVTPSEDLRLDIAARLYLGGEAGGTVEALLAANPGLAAAGGFVTAGVPLTIPAVDRTTPVLSITRPWD